MSKVISNYRFIVTRVLHAARISTLSDDERKMVNSKQERWNIWFVTNERTNLSPPTSGRACMPIDSIPRIGNFDTFGWNQKLLFTNASKRVQRAHYPGKDPFKLPGV